MPVVDLYDSAYANYGADVRHWVNGSVLYDSQATVQGECGSAGQSVDLLRFCAH
jgi:hypothetical protein